MDHQTQNSGEVRVVSAQVLAQLQAAGYQVFPKLIILLLSLFSLREILFPLTCL